MLLISNTEELLENMKAHFSFTMKNPVEILLTSDVTQHSSSLELASLQTQKPVGISNAGQDTLFHFPCVSRALSLFLSHFQISLQYAVLYIWEADYALDVKAHHAGRIRPPEGTAI